MTNPVVPNVKVFIDVMRIANVAPDARSPMLNIMVDETVWLSKFVQARTQRASSMRGRSPRQNVSIPSRYSFTYNECPMTVTHTSSGFFSSKNMLTFQMNTRTVLVLQDPSDEYKYFLYTLFEHSKAGNYPILRSGFLMLDSMSVEIRTAQATTSVASTLPDVEELRLDTVYTWIDEPELVRILPVYTYTLTSVPCKLRLRLQTVFQAALTVGPPKTHNLFTFEFDNELDQEVATSILQNFINLQQKASRTPMVDLSAREESPERITGRKRARSPPVMTPRSPEPTEPSEILQPTRDGLLASRVPSSISRRYLVGPRAPVIQFATPGNRRDTAILASFVRSRSIEGERLPSNMMSGPPNAPEESSTRIRSIQTPQGTRMYLTRR